MFTSIHVLPYRSHITQHISSSRIPIKGLKLRTAIYLFSVIINNPCTTWSELLHLSRSVDAQRHCALMKKISVVLLLLPGLGLALSEWHPHIKLLHIFLSFPMRPFLRPRLGYSATKIILLLLCTFISSTG